MPRDERDAGAPATGRIPVRVVAREHVMGTIEIWRRARRSLLDIIPAAAYRLPILAGPRRLDRKPGPSWLMVMDPHALEGVLKRRAAIYPRSDVTLRILRPREGTSLFTAPEETWRWQHRAMAPIFQRRTLEGLSPVMTDAAEATAGRIAQGGGLVDVYPVMVRATADVICDTALSGRESLNRAAITRSVTRFIESVARVSILDILGAPPWMPRPARLFNDSARSMDRRMDEIIAARLARGPSDTPDLLDLLVAARDPGGDGEAGGQGMSRVELRNNLLAFIIAGHETTALALTWALYLLAFDPKMQERAREEARDAIGTRAATAADLAKLRYLRQVIDEAMRLYPPAGLMTKTAKAEDEIAGHRLSPGATVMVPIWALHRHRLLWEEPDRFDPERFTPEAKGARHRFAYLPFSAGPHVCIGMQFALMEAQIILATLIGRFRFGLPEGFEPVPRMVFTLRPGTGMPLTVNRV